MTRAYQRRLYVRVGTREVSALDVGFTVDRSIDYTQNTARIQIFGLSAETRKDLQSRAGSGVNCEVLVGYADQPPPMRLFLGDLRVISSQRQGPEWITSIESGDGDIVKQTEVTGSWPEGSSLKQVVSDIAGALRQSGQDILSAMAGVPDQALDGPLAVHGRGDDALRDQLDKLGLEHSWQNQELQILRKNGSKGGNAVLLTPQTGLLDSPEVQGIRGFIRVPVVNASSLLNPLITPGGLVRVESSAWSGTLTARRVTHSGQSWGGEWMTSIEGLVQ